MLDAVGFDVVLVETVGVGQSEVEVAAAADTVVVVVAPGMGDGVQAAKAGILEIGDVYVVNKADRDGAELTARELRHMLRLGPTRRAGRLGAAGAADRRPTDGTGVRRAGRRRSPRTGPGPSAPARWPSGGAGGRRTRSWRWPPPGWSPPAGGLDRGAGSSELAEQVRTGAPRRLPGRRRPPRASAARTSAALPRRRRAS